MFYFVAYLVGWLWLCFVGFDFEFVGLYIYYDAGFVLVIAVLVGLFVFLLICCLHELIVVRYF